ncbi:hypothetical protein C8035_v007253 [Colletotrichum spinosum]|uniref:Uncharacterized protein n=1 Tax=Colletotrichum spinosum TaxID=1347390 RepID=A0A4R8QHK6_9PEZI|nr:hypothetical protein C8035_v007253 [Colletotrichum spinosum]
MAHSFRSPDTPSAYKTNIKRNKTKKWVEAKTQNYDGDDWGNDFEDDEPEEPVPPLRPIQGLRQPSPSQATTATLPSSLPPNPQPSAPIPVPSMRPPQPAAGESKMSTSPRATAGLPPLQIESKPQAAPIVVLPVPSEPKPPVDSGPFRPASVQDLDLSSVVRNLQGAHRHPPEVGDRLRRLYNPYNPYNNRPNRLPPGFHLVKVA